MDSLSHQYQTYMFGVIFSLSTVSYNEGHVLLLCRFPKVCICFLLFIAFALAFWFEKALEGSLTLFTFSSL